MADETETPKKPEETQEGKAEAEESQDSLSIVDEAKKVRDEIKAENDRRENILKEEQKLESERLLGGTNGGAVKTEPPKEISDEDYAKKALAGELDDKTED